MWCVLKRQSFYYDTSKIVMQNVNNTKIKISHSENI